MIDQYPPDSSAFSSRFLRFLTLSCCLALAGCQGAGDPEPSPANSDGSSDGSTAVGAGAASSLASGSQTSSTTDGSSVGAGAASSAANGAVTSTTSATSDTATASGGATSTATTTGGTGDCPDGAVQCPDRCANLSIDIFNCGECGNACADGQACIDGVCNCGIGETDCGSGCIDLDVSLEHCGACGNACAGDMVCSGGVCGTGCLAQYAKCDEGCRDTNSDVNNCGACGNACPATQVCRNGACTCGAAQLECDGVCRDVQSDTQNCGACGNVCSSGQWCADGFCLDDSTLDCAGVRAGETCENYTRDVYNMYYVFNNMWGADENNVSGEQCVWNSCLAGDLIGWGTEWNWPDTGGVKSFTTLILGWHWGWVVPQDLTILPVRLDSGEQVRCGWNFDISATGSFVIAYDLWTHASETPEQEDPSNEIMIWLYPQGNVAPLGSVQATVTIGGASWDVWRGPGGSTWEVFSFVRSSNTTNAVLNITDFTGDLVQRGWVQGNQYLVSIEAGAEVSGGAGTMDNRGFYCRK